MTVSPERPARPTKRPLSPASESEKRPGRRWTKVKKHHKKSDKNSIVLMPGTLTKRSPFTRLWTKEGELAGYLKCLGRHEMRQFAMSAYVLWPYVYSFQDRGHTQVRQRYVLEYIVANIKEMENEGDPRSVYPVQEDGAHVVPRMALAVCQMRRKIQKAISGQPAYCQKDHEDAQEQFRALTGRSPPKFPIDEVQLKPLGPFTLYEESDLEAYNRCFSAIMYASFSANGSTWEARFGSNKWADPVEITPEHIPHWMRRTNSKKPRASTLYKSRFYKEK